MSTATLTFDLSDGDDRYEFNRMTKALRQQPWRCKRIEGQRNWSDIGKLRIMSENKLNFLKSQISVFNPTWTKAQVEMEAIRIYNEGNTIDDDDEGCLYCGS